MTTKIGEYLDKIRVRRDPPPTPRFMSLEAGLSPSVVGKIINGDIKRPHPDTLKAIAERWGTSEDYRELMRLAGHPVPEPMIDEQRLLQATERALKAAGISDEQLQTLRGSEEIVEGLERLANEVGQSPPRPEQSSDLDLKLAQALRESGVEHIALRAVGLDDEAKEAILDMINYIRRAQGLNNQE